MYTISTKLSSTSSSSLNTTFFPSMSPTVRMSNNNKSRGVAVEFDHNHRIHTTQSTSTNNTLYYELNDSYIHTASFV
jgi:hypothetical protein